MNNSAMRAKCGTYLNPPCATNPPAGSTAANPTATPSQHYCRRICPPISQPECPHRRTLNVLRPGLLRKRDEPGDTSWSLDDSYRAMAQLAERGIILGTCGGRTANNKMIKAFDLQKFTGTDEIVGGINVGVTRRGIASGKIMDQHDGRRSSLDGFLKNRAGVHE